MTESSVFDPADRAVPYVDEGEGPVALVLIPEAGTDHDVLGVVSHYLAEEAGFRVLRIGHRPGGADLALADRADDVIAVMDHVGLSDAWIGGHGFGGTVAGAVVAQHHERANGLLLLGVEDAEIELAPVLPVLIVQATADEVTPAANAERLQAKAPERSSIKIVDGADHLFPVTHPVETAVIIEEYLDWD
ncbi:alpha/beta fold hydrolase [Microbacterium sp. CIAB417]|uniref:alpha/beta fold hydrolase n=1 Tax=Microbacterium sp. CIAB417 TaxID=2860287 RepID=UPI001FAE4A36|nr:alpha/beta hydrolase [Microbacterium sp. CIAB417]